MGPPPGGRVDDRPAADTAHAEPDHGDRSGADIRGRRPRCVRLSAVGRDRPHIRGHFRHPRWRPRALDRSRLSLWSLPGLNPGSLLGRGDLHRPGGLLRRHSRSLPALAPAGDGRRADRFVPGELCASSRPEPRLCLRLGLVRPTGAGGGHCDRPHLRWRRSLWGRGLTRNPHELHSATTHPRGVAARPRPAARHRARGGGSKEGKYSCPMTDPFSALVGHAQALDQLRSQLSSGRLAHAYLFVGEAGLGKSTAARLLAGALLPEAPLDRHPDYWEDDRIKPLSINEIRLLPDKAPEFHELSLQAFLNLKPGVGARRVALVANVGRLRDQDQGVLLKTLEEPHPQRVIVLTSPSLNPFVVLPTVVSRCQRVFFHPVPAADIERLLRAQGLDAERAAVLANLARGRPGWALRVAGDDSVIRFHREWTQRLEGVFGAPADVPLQVAAELDSSQMAWRRSEGDHEDPALFAIASWQIELRRRMLASHGAEQGRWARLVELSYDTLGYLEQNVSPRLAFECFLLECRKAS